MAIILEHILSISVFLPLVLAGLVFAVGDVNKSKWIAMIGAVLGFVLALILWWQFDGTTSDLQFVEAYEWLPSLGVKYIVGVDGISIMLVVLTAFLLPLVLLSVWDQEYENGNSLLGLLLLLQCGMMGALVSFDMVFFYVFWEAMLIPMYFMIGIWGGKRKIYAATKFVLYTVIGSLLMLAAAIYLYYYQYKTTDPNIFSTSLLDLYRLNLPIEQQTWLFAAFFVAFAIKVPMWPFHTWLPDAHVEAPTVGSVILAGVMLKMGTYGLLRFVLPIFPEAAVSAAPLIVFCGVVGIIYGALTAWVQTDAKKMVAYSSVSHLGFIVVGSFAVLVGGTLSSEALVGATYQMINHGVSTGALFFLVGCLYERRHTKDLNAFGGLAKRMPIFSILLIVATLSSVGLPGTGGFVGEFLILIGLFQASPVAAIFAGTGVLLGAIYMLTLCRKILFGPLDKEENKSLSDVSGREISYLAPLAILAILMGVFPTAFYGKSRVSIEHLAKNFSEYKLGHQLSSQE